MTIQRRKIDYRENGVHFEGLLTWDDARDVRRPGVLIAHTIRGRTDFEDDRATALARLGYSALAIDLYGIESKNQGIDELRALMMTLREDRPALQTRLLGWLDVLRAQSEVNDHKIAAIGFCFGGLCVLDIARTGAGLAGVVSFHGIFEPPGNTGGNRMRAKVLALHGWDDPLATPDDVVALAAELTQMGADWQIHGYGNTLHAFTNPAANDKTHGTVYDETADRRSWATMQSFFAELFGE